MILTNIHNVCFLEYSYTVFLNISNYLPHLELRNRFIQIVVVMNFVVISNVGIKRFDCIFVSAHSFSTEPTLEGSEDFSSFKYIAPKPCLELPTLVQMGKGKNEGDLKSPCVENSKPSPTENTTVSENSVPSFSATNGGSSNDPNASASFTEIEYKGTGLDATIHNFGARSEYDDNVLLMKQLEHEQRLKNLRYEHEMKREEHTLRMDLLKEEMEFVRLRKELLKRQLDTYISVLNV